MTNYLTPELGYSGQQERMEINEAVRTTIDFLFALDVAGFNREELTDTWTGNDSANTGISRPFSPAASRMLAHNTDGKM